MNKFDQEALYNLLPAILRVRDQEGGYPLKALLGVIAEQVAVLEEDLAQLYDDQFIETCAEWVVPYIGDLIGYRSLDSLSRAPISKELKLKLSKRAQVANTIAYRRRKGTAAMLEQLARDATGWEASVVEFFRRLATTQHVNHLRLENQTPDLRQWEQVDFAHTPFDQLAHTADVRRINSQHRSQGKYNIPNIGVFLWRLQAFPVLHSPAPEFDNRRYRFSPLGHDMPLYSEPEAEETITHLATYHNVPMPISRRMLHENKERYYGRGRSIGLYHKYGDDAGYSFELIEPDRVVVANLRRWDEASRLPDDKYAIDPVLGRFTRPPRTDREVYVAYHHGFSMPLGGGSYDRSDSLPLLPRDDTQPEDLMGVLETGGIAGIMDSERYPVSGALRLGEGQQAVLQADNGRWPTVEVEGEWEIEGQAGSTLILDGLLIRGGPLTVTGDMKRLVLRHCTLVPGQRLTWDGRPAHPDGSSLVVVAPNAEIEIERCIVGALRVSGGASVTVRGSIVDATAPGRLAYAAPDGRGAGGTLRVEESTVIGRVHTQLLDLASNSIFLAQAADDSEEPPVWATQHQEGCVRHCYLPPGARVPRRFYCQPTHEAQADRVRARFTTLRYGRPGYGQLRPDCPPEIWRGADDEAEMGVFHDLYWPQREANLRIRLEEYLRFGVEAGIFYAT